MKLLLLLRVTDQCRQGAISRGCAVADLVFDHVGKVTFVCMSGASGRGACGVSCSKTKLTLASDIDAVPFTFTLYDMAAI